jgi:hypothetical protein
MDELPSRSWFSRFCNKPGNGIDHGSTSTCGSCQFQRSDERAVSSCASSARSHAGSGAHDSGFFSFAATCECSRFAVDWPGYEPARDFTVQHCLLRRDFLHWTFRNNNCDRWCGCGDCAAYDDDQWKGEALMRGLAQTTSTPVTLSTSPSLSPIVLLAGAAIAALIFLPGWWKLLVPAGLYAALIAGNWQQCSQIAGESQSYLFDQTTGLPVPGSSASGTVMMGCPAGHVCHTVQGPATATPQLSCLGQLFVGGL